ncbi:MAG: hypothetical protein ACI837_000498 [Crocinitomicaceae bacterium]|jgi:hypothetical protein
MKELSLTYLGNRNKLFTFRWEEEDEIIRFHQVRSDLIYDFERMTEKFVNRLFNVKCFILEREDATTRIMSDLVVIY